MAVSNVRGLFVRELCEIYDAEHRFLDGQVKMVHKATDQELQRAIENHILQTRQHIGSLEQLFGELGEEPRRETNEAAQGLVSGTERGIEEAQGEALRDCLLDAAVIKVEHFEIGSYRGLLSGARLVMGQQSMAVDLLEANLRQEEETAQIAEQRAKTLLQKAMQAEMPEAEGLVDKIKRVKDRLGDR
jgi:ferritin-like metal-binding protein YciE